MTDHRFVVDPPTMIDPTLVVMMTGWIDASGAALAAMNALVEECDARPLVDFDDDVYVDYRARRPTLEIRNGVSSRLVWSSPQLLHGRDAKGADVLLLTGPEPDAAWHRFTATIGALAEQFGVSTMAALGAYPFATPHTREVRLSATSPSPEVLEALALRVSSIDVPAGMAAALEQTLHGNGVKSFGLWAQVPHYVAAMSFPAASVALLDALTRATGISVQARSLRREVVLQRERLDHLVASNDEHREMVARLESIYDDDATIDVVTSLDGALELTSGDDLAAEVERFLREHPKG